MDSSESLSAQPGYERQRKHWVVKAFDGARDAAYAADRGLMRTMDALDTGLSSLTPKDDTGGLKRDLHDILVPAGIDHLPRIPRPVLRHAPKAGRGCCDFLMPEEDEDYDVKPYKYLSVPMTAAEWKRAQGVIATREGKTVWELEEEGEPDAVFPVPSFFAEPSGRQFGSFEWDFWEPPTETEDNEEYKKQA